MRSGLISIVLTKLGYFNDPDFTKEEVLIRYNY